MPTMVVSDMETKEILDSQPGALTRGFTIDGAGRVHFLWVEVAGGPGPFNGSGVCTQAADRSISCSPTEFSPSARDAGTDRLFCNSAGTSTRGQLAAVGSVSSALVPTSNALQPSPIGMRDALVIDTQQSFLLGIVNAAFNGGTGPGELVTAFGQKIGPRKDSFGTSWLVHNALETNVEEVEVVITREDGSGLNAPVLHASFGQSTFEMPRALRVAELVTIRIRSGGLTSNPYSLTVGEPGIAPFLFNGNEAVVQHSLTAAVATMSDPMTPGEVGVLWANSGIERVPPCPRPGSVSDATGNPLHQLAGSETLTILFAAVTAERPVLFTQQVAFAGSPPGQLCNNVLQVNFAWPDVSAWSQANVQTAISESRALRDGDLNTYNRILAENPWIPVEDPVTGESVAAFVLLGN